MQVCTCMLEISYLLCTNLLLSMCIQHSVLHVAVRRICGLPYSCTILLNSRTLTSPLHVKSRTLQKSEEQRDSIMFSVIPSCSLLNYPHPTCCAPYSTGPHPPDEETLVRRGWRKAATLISAFMTGTKVFYITAWKN